MSIIDDDHELDGILEGILKSINLDEYELIDFSVEHPGDSSHEHTGVGMAPTSSTRSTSVLAPREGSSPELRSRGWPLPIDFSVSAPLLTMLVSQKKSLLSFFTTIYTTNNRTSIAISYILDVHQYGRQETLTRYRHAYCRGSINPSQ